VLDFLRLLPQASLLGTVGLITEIVFTSLTPIAMMFATGVLIAAVSGGTSPLPGSADPWIALGVMALLIVVLEIILPFTEAVTERLAYRVDLLLRERVLRAVLAPPTLAHLEDPGLANEVAMARTVGTESVQPPQIVAALSGIATARLLAVGSAVVLAGYRWWAPLVLVGIWLVSNEAYRRAVTHLFSSLEGSTTGFRRARYLSDLALRGGAAKELRLFGLVGWLAARFTAHWRAGMREAWTQGGRHRWVLLCTAGVVVAGHGLICALLAGSALQGDIGLGQLIVYVQAVLGMMGFCWDAENQYALHLGTAPVSHALQVCEVTAGPRFRVTGSRHLPDAPQEGIRFQGVSFAYPGSERQVLHNLDLWLPAQRSLAIVGDNGSGKTTLLKLLCRFYDPVHGSITVDGVDLRDLDASGWQRHIAAVFADFARYPLSVLDNIAFGDVRRHQDRPALQRAAAAAGATDMIERLPAGWDTPLSRQFNGGIDPSGGQWQRLALGRALFAVDGTARVLLLDEPTANLDIRAEAAFYHRFLNLTRGLTTVVVSHRFSTVRQADRIVVLDAGRVVEDGSHAELIAYGGRYAAMFALQATSYLQDDHV
jgi:ATP-binding cassette subfamily B protein